MRASYTIILIICLAFALLGCAVKPTQSATLGRFNFAYELKKQKGVGLIQVFDDGESTYLKFLPDVLEGSEISIETLELNLKPESVLGNVVIAPTLLNTFHVCSATRCASVKKIAAPPLKKREPL